MLLYPINVFFQPLLFLSVGFVTLIQPVHNLGVGLLLVGVDCFHFAIDYIYLLAEGLFSFIQLPFESLQPLFKCILTMF